MVNPNLDAIQETKIALRNYDAEFGKAIAGVVTVQTKSGSNDIHGSGFWFRRTDATRRAIRLLSMRPTRSPGRFIPSSRWQQFGGTIGGPIIKNKLFFFGDYQATRQKNGITQPGNNSDCSAAKSTCVASGTFCDLSDYASHHRTKCSRSANYLYDPTDRRLRPVADRLVFCGAARRVANPARACTGLPVGVPNQYLIPVSSIVARRD